MSLRLPDEFREDFRGGGPGIVASGDIAGILAHAGSGVLVCVGDVVSSYCAKVDRGMVLVVDGKTRRTEKIGDIAAGDSVNTVSNPPGRLSYHAWRTICELIDKARNGSKHTLIVNGEEDMLALAAFDCSMIGDVVVYGLPGIGAYIRVVEAVDKVIASSRILALRPEE